MQDCCTKNQDQEPHFAIYANHFISDVIVLGYWVDYETKKEHV